MHIGHKNILKFTGYDGQPVRGHLFRDVDEMNHIMVKNWNSIITDQDIVYNLGDVYFGDANEADKILSQLNGSKRLILGNHDDGKDKILHKHFQKILMWRIFKEFDCVLSHVPLHETSINEKVTWNVHGHIHQNDSPSLKHINVSVEKIGYKPVLLEDLIKHHKEMVGETFG